MTILICIQYLDSQNMTASAQYYKKHNTIEYMMKWYNMCYITNQRMRYDYTVIRTVYFNLPYLVWPVQSEL